MAEYQITVLTVGEPIPVGTSGSAKYAPYAGELGILSFPDASLSTITVSDDDGEYDTLRYASGETAQRLTADVTFGSGSYAQTLPAGTQLSNFIGSVISDADGHLYKMVFTRTAAPGTLGTEIGGKTSVLIFPQPSYDADGNEYYVPFDPSKIYEFVEVDGVGSADYSTSYSYEPLDVDCFAAGTLIDTAKGPRAVQTLCAGDLVLTRDHGLQALAWAGGTHLDATRLDLQPNLRPIRIAPDALGPGIPARALTVSPQHRVLVCSAIARRMFGVDEILVAAKHLLGLPGISVENPSAGISYYHLLFDRHQVLRSEGAWTESLFTAPQAMKGLGPAARREICALFPELARPGFVPDGARRLLNGREGRKLAQRHLKNAKPLASA